MRKGMLLFGFFGIFCCCSNVQGRSFDVQSPDGKLKVVIDLKEKIYYSVISQNDTILKDCTLSMTLSDDVLGAKPSLQNIKRGKIDKEVLRPIPLKNALVRNYCNTLRMNMKGNYSVEFRAYDNGIAYRFITDRKNELEVLDEEFAIHFPTNYWAHLSKTSGFKTSYENPYSHLNTMDYKSSDEMSYFPVLLESPQGYNILISEADLDDYPCMFVKGTDKNGLTAVFPKCPLEFGDDGDRSVKILKEANYIAKTEGKRTFPWRFFMISSDDKDILSNEMVYNLSSPCELEDYSWVKPGQVSWEWWNGATPYGPDVNFVSGFNMDTYKYFIDFAAKYHIPYILMDEGWALSTRDPYTPNPQVNVHEIIRYGKEKGVGVLLWLTWLTVENHFDVFKTFSDWGVAGIKIDFMDRDDQEMIRIQEDILKAAAKHRLFIQFHGSSKPSGLTRTYPNEFTREGTLNYEVCKWDTLVNADHDISIPFTRLLAGPADYHLGGFRALPRSKFKIQYVNPYVMSTRCHMMAMYVVLENHLTSLCDKPEAYEGQPGFEVLRTVPGTWDEIRVPLAEFNKYVTVARRSGTDWWVGTLNDGTARTLNLKLDFLEDGKYQAEIYTDAPDADENPNHLNKETRTVTRKDVIELPLAADGGSVLRISKL